MKLNFSCCCCCWLVSFNFSIFFLLVVYFCRSIKHTDWLIDWLWCCCCVVVVVLSIHVRTVIPPLWSFNQFSKSQKNAFCYSYILSKAKYIVRILILEFFGGPNRKVKIGQNNKLVGEVNPIKRNLILIIQVIRCYSFIAI